jgi:UDP-N-acetylglucosamine 1-carboxyvinyltransferase
VLLNAAREPEIMDLAECLTKMGAKIEGAGTDRMTIQGVTKLSGAEHTVIPDRLETGSYCIAPLIAGGSLSLTHTEPKFLESFLMLLQETGARIETGDTWVKVEHPGHRLRSIDLTTEPYPGIATDLQAPFMALMCISDGTSVIRETIFENRFMHVPELTRMGAHIQAHGDTAIIKGTAHLQSAPVMSTDIRASAALVLAALGARGVTVLTHISHLDRGYAKLEDKLNACGAHIQRRDT